LIGWPLFSADRFAAASTWMEEAIKGVRMKDDEKHAPSRIDASVLVPVLNEERYIRRAVEAMLSQEFDGPIEFLIADGGSTDGTLAILDELAAADPRIRLFDNPRRIIPSGLNLCLRNARGEHIVRMDAHTYYPSNYIASGVARLARGGTSWVAGPQVLLAPENREGKAIAIALSKSLGRGPSKRLAAAWEDVDREEFDLDTGVFTGIWKREVLIRFGGWDENWPRNQDSELAARFLAAGERIVCLPEMAANYVPRATLRSLFSQYSGYGYYRTRTAKRHPNSLRRSHIAMPVLVLDPIVALLSPAPVWWLAGALAALYLVLIVLVAARAGISSRDPALGVLVGAAFVVMHLSFGIGMLRGMARFGVPVGAFVRILGLGGFEARRPQRRARVYAPSLHLPTGI
jgi:glycosyltransferase involved in cell wall biosynthesis